MSCQVTELLHKTLAWYKCTCPAQDGDAVEFYDLALTDALLTACDDLRT